MCAADYHHAFGPITSDAQFGMHVFTLADDDEEEEQLDEPEEGQQDNNNGPANYCEFCEQWLNGPTQWEDHIIGKKHKKNRKKKKTGRRVKQQQIQERQEEKNKKGKAKRK